MGKKIGIGLVGLLVLLQLVPYGCSHDNPAVKQEPAWDRPETRALAQRACFDCHSNETVWPWYSHVAPVRFLVAHHVEDGRKHLNFSEWDRPQKHAHEAAEEIEEGEMPMAGYVLLHGEADLSEAEKKQLMASFASMFGKDEHDEHDTPDAPDKTPPAPPGDDASDDVGHDHVDGEAPADDT